MFIGELFTPIFLYVFLFSFENHHHSRFYEPSKSYSSSSSSDQSSDHSIGGPLFGVVVCDENALHSPPRRGTGPHIHRSYLYCASAKEQNCSPGEMQTFERCTFHSGRLTSSLKVW